MDAAVLGSECDEYGMEYAAVTKLTRWAITNENDLVAGHDIFPNLAMVTVAVAHHLLVFLLVFLPGDDALLEVHDDLPVWSEDLAGWPRGFGCDVQGAVAVKS